MSLAASRVSLIHRCAIERLTRVPDGGGGQTEQWATHLEDVPCRVLAPELTREQEATIGDRVAVVEDRRVMVGLDTDVQHEDRLGQLTDRGTAMFARPLRIDAIGRYRTHLELLVTEVS